MATLHVVLVEPKNGGNVGAVARAMKNFGVPSLILVNPPPLGEEARRRAMHSLDILEGARKVATLEEALADMDLVVATTGIATASEKRFVRLAQTPAEFAARMREVEGNVALLFGREDFGLYQEEIARADLLVTIPASPAYPILNIGHACAVLLYEYYGARSEVPHPRPASGLEKEKLHEAFAALLAAIDYPEHKKGRTRVMFRRLLGRATPSKWEFHALMGVFTGAVKALAPQGQPRAPSGSRQGSRGRRRSS